MSYTDVEIVNFAGALIGGFGNQVSASGQIVSLSATDPVSVWANLMWPKARQQVIHDLAVMKAPIRETIKLAELDDELTDRDVTISDITSSGGLITVTTKEVHGKSTGNTVVIKGVDADSGVGAADVGVLNGNTYTITVLTTTTFTLDSTTGDDSFDYTEDSGIISEAPELGPYNYAFDQPSTAIAVVRVMDESFDSDENTRRQYRFGTMLNRDDGDMIIVTNELTNADNDGIYIEYCIDQSTPTLFALENVNAIATMLAHLLAPVVGRNTDFAMAMLAKYKNQALPDAAAFNQSQINKTAKARTDFRGGRTATLPRSI